MKRSGLMFLISGILCLMVGACNNQSDGNEQKPTKNDPKESLVKVNRYLVKSEQEDINNYIRRHKWNMKETGSGLRYMVYEHGNGSKAEKGQIAELAYKLWLINGDLVYSSEQEGLKIFQIGRGGVESGLEEGILLLNEGDKARFILPSHLAHGLLGDEKKIPPYTAIIYDLEIVKLN